MPIELIPIIAPINTGDTIGAANITRLTKPITNPLFSIGLNNITLLITSGTNIPVPIA